MSEQALEQFMRGGGLKGLAIKDSHMHVGKIATLPFSADNAQIVSDMKQFSIAQGLISTIRKYDRFEDGNLYTLETVQQFPERFRGQIFFSPLLGQGAEEVIEHYYQSGCFAGIKIHPEYNGLSLNDQRYLPLFAIAGDLNLPILIHTWTLDNDILPLDRIARDFPQTIFIMGHMGGKERSGFEACLDIVKRHDNVFADTALTWTFLGRIEEAVTKVSSKKFLFGSDANYNSIPAALGRVIFAKIRSSQKEDVLFGNYNQLYDF